MLLIKNTHMTDPASGTDAYKDILIQDEKIIKIADSIPETEAAVFSGEKEDMLQIIKAEGMIAAPGLVDAHVHFRDPGFTEKEDIDTGAGAAAAGGVTTVVLMANTRPCVDNRETLDYVLEETARNAMKTAAVLGVPISFHEENPAFIENNGINRGKASGHFGIGGSGRQAEIDMIERDVRLAEETGATVVIQHISTKEGVALVREAKRRGADVHAEATPHHFTLTEDAVIQYGSLAKMNPPLREEADRQAIIEGLQDNTIDMIATDHAPHTAREKEKPLTEAPSGIIGLETSLSLGIMNLVDTGKLTLLQLLERMSLVPARLYHLDAGYLAEGGPADLILFDEKELWKAEHFHSKSSNTPFLGWEMKGRIHYTICAGKIVYHI